VASKGFLPLVPGGSCVHTGCVDRGPVIVFGAGSYYKWYSSLASGT